MHCRSKLQGEGAGEERGGEKRDEERRERRRAELTTSPSNALLYLQAFKLHKAKSIKHKT